ncbi:MAG TPA: SPOR domain-containing protein [Chitinophagaceae bacterium]
MSLQPVSPPMIFIEEFFHLYMTRSVLILALTLVISPAFASDSTLVRPAADSSRGVRVKKDQRIDLLNKKQTVQNRYGTFAPHRVREKGYRIQVISTQSRTEALAIKADLLSRFPGQQTYLFFREPFFKIRIGNFRTRAEANDFAENLLRYPGQVFIVADMIEYMWYPPASDE